MDIAGPELDGGLGRYWKDWTGWDGVGRTDRQDWVTGPLDRVGRGLDRTGERLDTVGRGRAGRSGAEGETAVTVGVQTRDGERGT